MLSQSWKCSCSVNYSTNYVLSWSFRHREYFCTISLLEFVSLQNQLRLRWMQRLSHKYLTHCEVLYYSLTNTVKRKKHCIPDLSYRMLDKSIIMQWQWCTFFSRLPLKFFGTGKLTFLLLPMLTHRCFIIQNMPLKGRTHFLIQTRAKVIHTL